MRRRRAVGEIHYGGLGKEEPHSEVFSLAKCRLRVPGSLEFGEVYLKKNTAKYQTAYSWLFPNAQTV